MNEAEELLSLHLKELGLHFERQYEYAQGRRFKADFAVWRPCATCEAWADVRDMRKSVSHRFALIEVQGGIYNRKAHGSITGVKKDNERLYWAYRAGWFVLRFTPDQVKSGEAKRLIQEAIL